MKTLYVLFDSQCALCHRCRYWLQRQPAFIELRFLPLQSPFLDRQFPGIARFQPGEQLVAVSDEGAVYQGSRAWIMCLYALRDFREWSFRLASPALLPWARRVCEHVSANRLSLSGWFEKLSDEQLAEALAGKTGGQCENQRQCGS